MPLNVDNDKQYDGFNNHIKQGFEEVFNVYNNEQKVTNQVCNITQVFMCVIFTVINKVQYFQYCYEIL